MAFFEHKCLVLKTYHTYFPIPMVRKPLKYNNLHNVLCLKITCWTLWPKVTERKTRAITQDNCYQYWGLQTRLFQSHKYLFTVVKHMADQASTEITYIVIQVLDILHYLHAYAYVFLFQEIYEMMTMFIFLFHSY